MTQKTITINNLEFHKTLRPHFYVTLDGQFVYREPYTVQKMTKTGKPFGFLDNESKIWKRKDYQTTKDGYLEIWPKKNEINLIHQLVYSTKLIEEGYTEWPLQDNGRKYEVDHINDIRTDNRIENLRLVSHAENTCKALTVQRKRESRLGKIYYYNPSDEEKLLVTKSEANKLREKGWIPYKYKHTKEFYEKRK